MPKTCAPQVLALCAATLVLSSWATISLAEEKDTSPKVEKQVDTETEEKRWGQKVPGLTPKIFAPGIVSKKDRFEFGFVVSRDGQDFYFGVAAGEEKPEIWHISFEDGEWGEESKLLGDEHYGYNDPFLSPDETRLYFTSSRPLELPPAGKRQGTRKDTDIWYIEKQGQGWSDPIHTGDAINSPKREYYTSFTDDGDLYFASNAHTSEDYESDYDLYFSALEDGVYQEAVRLGGKVNTRAYEADVFVARDGTYVIFATTRRRGFGRDLYVSFKDVDGEWAKAKSLGEAINTEHLDFCPFVTPDGQFLFYTSNEEVYWVDAAVIETLR